jgi:hypothetical protein
VTLSAATVKVTVLIVDRQQRREYSSSCYELLQERVLKKSVKEVQVINASSRKSIGSIVNIQICPSHVPVYVHAFVREKVTTYVCSTKVLHTYRTVPAVIRGLIDL